MHTRCGWKLTLSVGEWDTAQIKARLENIGIKSIVHYTEASHHKLKNDPDIQYLQIPIDDCAGENIGVHFETANKFIGILLSFALELFAV